MLNLLLLPVVLLYLIAVGIVFIYGLNLFYLTFLAWRKRATTYSEVSRRVSLLEELPLVSVQLPLYNERYVVGRLIEAAAWLDYPSHRYEIQILDDSTDDTTEIIQAAIARLKDRGVYISHIRRRSRHGFKAGALAEGLCQARGEFIAIFDADFLPEPGFLRRMLPHFEQPDVAFAQARWGHFNREASWLTITQSLSIDAHFMIAQYARSQAGYWFNFNGTAGIWRRAAIEDAGGWQAETLTEDLDLAYRAFLRGWKGRYDRNVVAVAELPVSFGAYQQQQGRWVRGSLECARKFLSQIWSKPLPPGQKIQATFHLTGYIVHPLLFLSMLLSPIILWASAYSPPMATLLKTTLLFSITSFAPMIYLLFAQQQLGRRWMAATPYVLTMPVLGIGMMLNSLRAVYQAFIGRKGVFERTPKYGGAFDNRNLSDPRYRVKFDALALADLALVIFNLGVAWYAIYLGNWAGAIYAGLYSIGFFYSSLQVIGHSFEDVLHKIRNVRPFESLTVDPVKHPEGR